MHKILFLATYPTQTNGYARIGARLTNFLCNHFDIYYYGFSNFTGEDYSKRYIDPRIKLIDVCKNNNNTDSFGINELNVWVEKIKPKFIFVYNDLIVSCRVFNELNKIQNKTFKVINYIDLVYDYENLKFLRFLNNWSSFIFVFSEHWKQNLMSIGIENEKIEILPHGFDDELFYPVNKLEARKAFNLNENDFIILNNNRNSYRKAQDIGISAFIKLLIRNNFDLKLKYFIHCDLYSDSGYDIEQLIEVECIKHNLKYSDIQKHFLIINMPRISDERMNLLYNACDIGINTCVGEGFGLCNLEHGGLNKPQLVSRVGGLKDIFKFYSEFTVEPFTELHISKHTDEHVGIIKICKAEDFTDKLDLMYKNSRTYEVLGNRCGEYIKSQYNWNDILSNLLNNLNKLL